MNDKDSAKDKNTINLLAVIMAFIMGLTLGNIDTDALNVLRNKLFYSSGQALINRENAAADSSYENTEGADSQTDTEESTTEKVVVVSSVRAVEEGGKGETTIPEDFFTIYRTPTGERYHYSQTCAGENGIVTTFEEAEGLGLTPCKKCADG